MTRFDFSDDSFTESLDYNLDEEISSTFARLTAGGEMAGSLPRVLNALLDQREKEAESKYEQARSYLDFVHAETVKIRECFLKNSMTAAYEGVLPKKPLSAGDIAVNPTLVGDHTSPLTPNFFETSNSRRITPNPGRFCARVLWGDAPEMESLENRQEELGQITTAVEVPKYITYQQPQEEIERRWEVREDERVPDQIWDHDRQYIDGRCQTFVDKQEVQRSPEHDLLWEAALMIAEGEKRADDEQGISIEKWYKEIIRQQDQTISHAGPPKGDIFHCDKCKQTFPSRRKLTAHKKTHNRAEIYTSTQFQCLYCFKSFTTAANQSRHERSSHSSAILRKWEM